MDMIKTKDPKFVLRHATVQDAGLIVAFMHKLGAYQKMADEIIVTEDNIRNLLETSQGEAVFGIYEGKTVGFMFFCQKSSAFTGRSGLFIDAFFIDEGMRHLGLGKVMMAYLSKLALARGGQMLEWVCLDWNAATIKFYEGLGAYSLDMLTTYRLSPDDLRKTAGGF
ncbi:MAG: GNAT family N-acetyltransferase [Albidovulum sp.]